MLSKMFKNLVNKIKALTSKKESVILPPVEDSVKKKPYKVIIVKMPDDVLKLRPKLEEHDLILLNIKKAKFDIGSSQIKRLKYMAESFGFKLYGIDTNWLMLTRFELERKKKDQ